MRNRGQLFTERVMIEVYRSGNDVAEEFVYQAQSGLLELSRQVRN